MLKTNEPEADATDRITLIYERRRQALLNLFSLLASAESTHHHKATRDRGVTGNMRWKDSVTLATAMNETARVLRTLGMSEAEVEAVMKVMP